MAMKPKIKDQVITDQYAIYNGDAVEVMAGIPDESIGFSIHSPPFADLFVYSDHPKDLGNCKTYAEFFEHYAFVVEELQRIMMPGRVSAVHTMDLPRHKGKEGFIGLRDFPGDIVKLFEKHNFVYHSRHCIWKDPLLAATRTHCIGLAHKQIAKDSAVCRTGIPDYILGFMKKGVNPKPIAHPEGLTEYVGRNPIPRNFDRFQFINPFTGEPWSPKTNKRSHWIWQQYASPVWDDIDYTRVLAYKAGKDKDDARHLCPLALDIIHRCLTLWSAEGDTVFSPFMGVGSEVYEAVLMGRKGVSAELKSSYFRQAVRNLESLKTAKKTNKKLGV